MRVNLVVVLFQALVDLEFTHYLSFLNFFEDQVDQMSFE